MVEDLEKQIEELQEQVFSLNRKYDELNKYVRDQDDPSQLVYIRVKNKEQQDDFINAVFENRIHHEAHTRYILSMALRDKVKLEELGYEFVNATPPEDLGLLPTEDRIAFKKKAIAAAAEARRETVAIIKSMKRKYCKTASEK